MTTVKKYYTDAYTHQFQARVASLEPVSGGHFNLILEETYFYPTSGGQPHDTGRMNGIPVCDVALRPEDLAVVHRLEGGEGLAPGTLVAAEIDWSRRFDHMQQHTGQHILSQAFVLAAGAPTVGFHLGQESCTIDLETAKLGETAIEEAERLANRIIWENRPVTARFVSHAEADALPLRKRPDVAEDVVRLIEIADFDLNACGGTHVAHTGEVGQIKITRLERRREKSRIEFLCGGRALDDYGRHIAVLNDLIVEMTTSPEALLAAIQKLKEENKGLQRALREARSRSMARLAVELTQQMERTGDLRHLVYVIPDEEGSVADLRGLANALTDEGSAIAFLGLSGDPAFLLFKKSEALPGHLGDLLKEILSRLNSRSGGGGPHVAQGGGFAADPDQLREILSEARAAYFDRLAPSA